MVHGVTDAAKFQADLPGTQVDLGGSRLLLERFEIEVQGVLQAIAFFAGLSDEVKRPAGLSPKRIDCRASASASASFAWRCSLRAR